MKKYFAIAVLGVITLSSCKKEHTCSCTASDPKFNTAYIIKDTEQGAKNSCEDYGKEYAGGTAGGTCELK